MPFTLCPAFLWRFITRERVKGAIAAPLTIPAPGKKIVASQYPPLIPPGYRGGREVASLQNAP